MNFIEKIKKTFRVVIIAVMHLNAQEMVIPSSKLPKPNRQSHSNIDHLDENHPIFKHRKQLNRSIWIPGRDRTKI